MINKNYYEVLYIGDNSKSVDMIQAFMGNKCLGTFFQNGTAQLYFIKGLREEMDIQLKKLLSDKTIQWKWKTLVGEDWHLNWQDHFKPVLIENTLAVIPPWESEHSAAVTIRIKPGMAFGTGHHETTWLMLRQLLKYLQPKMSVLDLGTGSGILSIAAKKIGACKVDAVENDQDCETNFHENLKLNKITTGIQLHNEDALSWNKLDYDLILANINSKVIEKLIPRLIAVQGIILLSGLLETDYRPIEQLCQKYKFHIKEKMIKGEWVCLAVA